MAIARFLESYVFGPSGIWTMAPLRYAAKFDPFLSLDCAPTPSTLAQSKEGIKFWHLATLKASLVGNEALSNVFYAVAMDTYDEPSGIHPRNKQIVGERLSMTGGLVAYGLEGPLQGPVPVDVSPDGQEFTAQFGYDVDISYNNEETSGFWVCCSEFDECNNAWLWSELPKEAVAKVAASSLTRRST